MIKKMQRGVNAQRNAFETVFASKGLQKPIVFEYDITDSTNTRAKVYAQEYKSIGHTPIVFFSRAQSAGRGTRSRTFESPGGAGVYISFLVKPDLPASKLLTLTTYTACCVCKVVERLTDGALSPRIKWVNDITVADKKLAGILTEGRITDDGICEYAIVGIGINLTRAEHSPEVAGIMTTLADWGVSVDAHTLASHLAAEFFLDVRKCHTHGYLDEYRRRSSIIGRRVNILRPDGTQHGAHVNGISDDYALIATDDAGITRNYISADISVRPSDETNDRKE